MKVLIILLLLNGNPIQLEVEKDSLGYMQNLETWLNNHTWEKYEDINYDDTKSTEETQRITRQL